MDAKLIALSFRIIFESLEIMFMYMAEKQQRYDEKLDIMIQNMVTLRRLWDKYK